MISMYTHVKHILQITEQNKTMTVFKCDMRGRNKQLRHGSYQNTTFVAANVAQVFTGPLQLIGVFRQHVGVDGEGRREPDASCSALSAIARSRLSSDQRALLPAKPARAPSPVVDVVVRLFR